MVCSALTVVVQLSRPWNIHTLHPGPRPLRSTAVLKGLLKKGPLARGPWPPARPLWILDRETGPGMASIILPIVLHPCHHQESSPLGLGGWLVSWHVADILMGADWDISTPGRARFLEGLGGEDRGCWEAPQGKVWGLPVCWWVMGSWGPDPWLDLAPWRGFHSRDVGGMEMLVLVRVFHCVLGNLLRVRMLRDTRWFTHRGLAVYWSSK